ncbi:MAG: signal peptidase I [Erythrobacter sp.]|uniref:signal peptidase I n=1 Tax=Erythrobacter sp. TaxID=1042 RepID=UPI002619E6F7|nr:signal peptidase I [Erythrobacter sp.]MDJ0977346.1 signal peptidase I [Erythrobacter sp.]
MSRSATNDAAGAWNGSSASATTAPGSDVQKPDSLLGFAWFLVKLVLAVLILRSFIFSPFSIPSDSMLPKLWQGDYFIASKWPYGYSRYSLPFNAPLIPGRILASAPKRGDVVVFKHPISQEDYIKRVIGLPGDTIGMVNGRVVLNGTPLAQEQAGNFAIPLTAIDGCPSGEWRERGLSGEPDCLIERSRETLPNGRTQSVLDFAMIPQDNMAPVTVPDDSVFVMGDHRDRSADSRFPAEAQLGVGMVPIVNLVGRAEFIVWSTDGSAEWIKPWTWFTAARWDRIGTGL